MCGRVCACRSNIKMVSIAWVKCERKEDKNYPQVFFQEAKITGRPSSGFFVENNYVRLSLVTRKHDFDMLIPRLEQLISQEDENSTAQTLYFTKFRIFHFPLFVVFVFTYSSLYRRMHYIISGLN